MQKNHFRISVASPLITHSDILKVGECLKSGWISGISPYVEEFERKFAEYCGCKYGVATNSGTTALHLALATLKVGPGDEVIIPTFTMIATANAVAYTGAKPVLVDSEAETWNIDPRKIESKINKKTKVIMPVDTYGHPANMDAIREIAVKHGLHIVEDAAEAHGAEYKSRKAGSLGDVGCFSFYANKIITTGEGGMLVTNDFDLAERARWLRAHAFGRGGKHFYHEEIGFGYRMSGLQAALGISQLSRLTQNVERRRKNARLYNELLSGLGDKVILPPEAPWAKNVYWMYSILVRKGFGVSRNKLIELLAREGIESRTFFYPIHVQPAYSSLASSGAFPVADTLSRSGINLPSGNDLTEQQIHDVCDAVKRHAR
jgi:perosamine synthetase